VAVGRVREPNDSSKLVVSGTDSASNRNQPEKPARRRRKLERRARRARLVGEDLLSGIPRQDH
jgi:hypothetical protein